MTARHLQDDLMKAGTSASVATIRHALTIQPPKDLKDLSV